MKFINKKNALVALTSLIIPLSFILPSSNKKNNEQDKVKTNIVNEDSIQRCFENYIETNQDSKLEQSIEHLKYNSILYYSTVLNNNLTKSESIELFKKKTMDCIEKIEKMDDSFYQLASKIKDPNILLHTYFKNNGYYFSLSGFDYKSKSGISVFLAKITEENKVSIPLFDSEKKHVINVKKYEEVTIPSMVEFQLNHFENKSLIASFLSNYEKNTAIIDEESNDCVGSYNALLEGNLQFPKYFEGHTSDINKYEQKFKEEEINNKIIHEGTHAYLNENFPNISVSDGEYYAYINQIINGNMKHSSLYLILNNNLNSKNYSKIKTNLEFFNKLNYDYLTEDEIKKEIIKIYHKSPLPLK